MEKLTKYLKPLMLVGFLLIAAGCSDSEETGNSSDGEENTTEQENEGENGTEAEGKTEENVRTVLEHVFTGPNESHEELFSDDFETKAEKITEYNKENFEPYMSENFFDSFINTNGALIFLQSAHPDYIMEVDEINLGEDEGDYSFIVTVAYTNTESDETETMDVEGHIQTNEDGMLTSINYKNAEDLRSAMG
ncbi:hypothetical protein [Thalassobacillus sp. CUG 92003]|uniref:hypothetical protein n=1 Tax=Thalassobacillus sp. CUG 92003 TaxID=2736641 RepID=UPI0015E68464|nr:hypothetical protein [Thalassobacillus sp. CUG 92003]